MRLSELEPRWVVDRDGRHGMGIGFNCPHCIVQRLVVWFANPIDGGPATDGQKMWQRAGGGFEDLSLYPSVDASGAGHWHGWISGGDVT